MTSRRAALPEFTAYRERLRAPLPRSIRWRHVAIGFALAGLPTGLLIVAVIGWLG